MPPELDPNLDLDEEYASEEDSDFAPDAATAAAADDDDELSASDDETTTATTSKPIAGGRKRPADNEAEDVGFVNSGDEAIIEKGKKRRKKPKRKDGAEPDDDEAGGEGGLVKTRSMRAVEKAKRQTITTTGPVTIDVDALWAQMTSSSSTPSAAKPSTSQQDTPPDPSSTALLPQRDPTSTTTAASAATSADQPELIRIKRTYNFAGKVHSEEKLVARDSAEARLYLASLGEDAPPEGNEDPSAAAAAKRMPKKAFRSAFEPATDQALQPRADLNLGVAVRLRAREAGAAAAAKKLNTVEKSRMDWAGYVDKEGIKDELALAGKSKDSFAAREGFLARSEALREEDARRVRLAAGKP
ncbi:bucentaur or craniofacial development-domain-containing protein [Podospora appendiculata]|uniref:SWR1-complex protein 5 n=1 Tax=Podospora appendiculata TaxID=314037 RepID=A0AAE0XF03_9PEZI|nr:bucentaur or craniofacial development-domain-containing protein [Podospora appendiculata]